MHPTAERLRIERAWDHQRPARATTAVAPAIEGAHDDGRTTIAMAPHAAATRMQVSSLGGVSPAANGDPRPGDASGTEACESPAGEGSEERGAAAAAPPAGSGSTARLCAE